MKIGRFGPVGAERTGIAVDDTGWVDVSDVVPTLDGAALADGAIGRLRAVDTSARPRLGIAGVRLGAPITGVGKVVCIGLNYDDHARESGQEPPAEPVVFMKDPSTIIGPGDEVYVPPGAEKVDWEVELGVVIGSTARYLAAPEEAWPCVAGLVVSHDVSERAYQLERGGQWDKGKSCERFNPLGPWLVTLDEVADVQRLHLWLDVNGQRRQDGNTSNMLFGVADLVCYLSQFMVLRPGDLINTGTPAGVGLGMHPPQYLVPGDRVQLGIDGLGEQSQHFVAAPGTRPRRDDTTPEPSGRQTGSSVPPHLEGVLG